MTLKARYEDRLSSIPAPGGNGCHPSLLSVANRGILAGLPPPLIFKDIREAIPKGGRRVPDREIEAAINRALTDHKQDGNYQAPPKPKPIVQNGNAALQTLIAQAEIDNEMDLIEASPIRLLDPIETDPITLLDAVFAPDDLLFIGDRHEPGILGKNIRRRDEWLQFFESGRAAGPFIIVNPLTGKPALKKSGDGETLRGDACISAYRHVLVEFDNLSEEEQIRFWSVVQLPVKALIWSGGKSIHAWIDAQKLAEISTSTDWDIHVRDKLFARILKALGADAACSNPARLARLPGVLRKENGTWQRLLWLVPEGRWVVNA